MEEFFALGKDDAPENIPMMFITMPSAKDPEAKIRNPGTNLLLFLPVLTATTFCKL
jgi:all-trans-retinol 13,14-reductase